MEAAHATPTIAAEIHNMHLQLAFVKAGYGFGLLPERFVARHGRKQAFRSLNPSDFELRMAIAIVRAGSLGSLETAADTLRDGISQMLATRKP